MFVTFVRSPFYHFRHFDPLLLLIYLLGYVLYGGFIIWKQNRNTAVWQECLEVNRSAPFPVRGLTLLKFAICLCALGSFWLNLICKICFGQKKREKKLYLYDVVASCVVSHHGCWPLSSAARTVVT